MTRDRRDFLATATGLGLAAAASGIVSPAALRAAEKAGENEEHAEEGVTATEDLMREHGVLRRIMLIYEEGLRRLRGRRDVSADVFHTSASLVRKFVEDYHEKLEEKFIFPEFEKRRRMTELVETLRNQHAAGRKVTEVILRASEAERSGDEQAARELARSCRAFIRMYGPHACREDTVLFPALHGLLSPEQIHELGEQFEEQEEDLFGEGGFEKAVEQVAAIEKELGIYDLAQFTPA
jgi:hemerythrin-like domain-containing protein